MKIRIYLYNDVVYNNFIHARTPNVDCSVESAHLVHKLHGCVFDTFSSCMVNLMFISIAPKSDMKKHKILGEKYNFRCCELVNSEDNDNCPRYV